MYPKKLLNKSQRFADELEQLGFAHKRCNVIYQLLERRRKRRTHSQIKKSIDRLESLTGFEFAELTDDMIDHLSSIAEDVARDRYARQYPDGNPLIKNNKEKDLTIFMDRELAHIGRIKVTPWVEPNTRRLMEKIPIVGPYCPDLIIYGLGRNGEAATYIEVDGRIHDTEKGSKDASFDQFLTSIGFYAIRIPAHKVYLTRPDSDSCDFDRGLCAKVVDEIKNYRIASESEIHALQTRVKLVNIATWLSLAQIDHIIREKFKVEFHLADYLKLEFYKANAGKWTKGAKSLFKLTPKLSNSRMVNDLK
ncbi:MAG: hypothetical protein AB7F86_08180 [Bdellovibrionales bacterium]